MVYGKHFNLSSLQTCVNLASLDNRIGHGTVLPALAAGIGNYVCHSQIVSTHFSSLRPLLLNNQLGLRWLGRCATVGRITRCLGLGAKAPEVRTRRSSVGVTVTSNWTQTSKRYVMYPRSFS
jgi:hypothetical protein